MTLSYKGMEAVFWGETDYNRFKVIKKDAPVCKCDQVQWYLEVEVQEDAFNSMVSILTVDEMVLSGMEFYAVVDDWVSVERTDAGMLKICFKVVDGVDLDF